MSFDRVLLLYELKNLFFDQDFLIITDQGLTMRELRNFQIPTFRSLFEPALDSE
jgi:hypothetical protein